MKNRTDRVLLGIIALSVPLCIWAWLFDIRLILIFPAVPFFCLQLLLLRRTRVGALRAVPGALVALTIAAGGYISLTVKGFEGILGIILLLGSIAPAVGCGLACLIYFCRR